MAGALVSCVDGSINGGASDLGNLQMDDGC
jgi:hypothetical protein